MMSEPKTSMGIPPFTIKGHTFRIGRIVRFVIGVTFMLNGLFKGPYDDLKIWGIKLAVGALLIDPTLLKDAMSAWKSRNGR